MKLSLLFYILFFSTQAIAEQSDYSSVINDKVDQSKINWLLDRNNIQEARGGTTNGVEPEIDTQQSKYFLNLQETSNKKEKDRLAILAMAGNYKANFEFTEIFGSNPNYKLDNPYKSWGTETILVIEDNENFISLQHILVMFIEDEKGNIKGPFVQKHWRQDWSYEDKKIVEFQGKNKWSINQYEDIKKTWSQAVFQVDDSPRYESFGQWVHKKGASSWISQMTNRPLPRREHSIRDDYDYMQGINKISVLPWGWVMEENNDKIKLFNKFIGTEYGIARYQKVKNYDFSSAVEYWKSTKLYWNLVRKKWDIILLNQKEYCLKKTYKEKPLFLHHFLQAEEYKNAQDLEISKKQIDKVIHNFISYKCEY